MRDSEAKRRAGPAVPVGPHTYPVPMIVCLFLARGRCFVWIPLGPAFNHMCAICHAFV